MGRFFAPAKSARCSISCSEDICTSRPSPTCPLFLVTLALCFATPGSEVASDFAYSNPHAFVIIPVVVFARPTHMSFDNCHFIARS